MKCPVCNSKQLKVIYESILPYSSAILSSKMNDKINTGEFCLTECLSCRFVFNKAFDLESINKYYSSNNYVVKSILPGQMSKNISFIFDEIVKKVSNKNVAIEIGSGRGDFAINLATIFDKVYTIDPSVDSLEYSRDNIEHFNTFFNKELLTKIKKPNLIVARHLLEHLQNPSDFINEINEFIFEQDCLVYIEIPNFNEIVNSNRFYDLFYDHFGYFYNDVFENMLRQYNLEIVSTISMFNSQHIGYFCRSNKNMNSKNMFFKKSIQTNYLFNVIKNKLNNYLNQYNNCIIWGAGAHGLTLFYNLDKNNQDKVLCFIDNDNAKQGKYIPGTTIEIKSDKYIQNQRDIVIIISAALYENEIETHILNINPEVSIIKPINIQ